MFPSGTIDAVATELAALDGGASGLGIAWARVLPTVLGVPAFGVPYLPWQLRAALGFGLAVCAAPALGAHAAGAAGPWPLILVEEALRGVPVAVTAATAVYAATTAGGVADVAVRASPWGTGARQGERGSLSTLLGVLACVLFLEGGGASRIASELAVPDLASVAPLEHAVRELARGVELGVTLALPLLVVALIVDVTVGLASRELTTLRTETLGPPLRALSVLVAFAALFERIAEGIALFSGARP